MNTIFHNNQVVIFPFFPICLNVHIYIRSQQLISSIQPVSITPLVCQQNLQLKAPNLCKAQLLNVHCINFLRGPFERIGTLLQLAHSKEANKIFPTLEKAQWEEPGTLTIRSFPPESRPGACCERAMEPCRATALCQNYPSIAVLFHSTI